MSTLYCSLPNTIEAKEVGFTKPRRCAQRLMVNTENASGVQSLGTLLNPVKSGFTCTENQTPGRKVPRCLSKIGPKPTTLQVPSSFEETIPATPPAPQLSREERDAKHKLLLLLWESYRYQRRQMKAMYSSSASATSSGGSANTSSLNSGGNSPQHQTPPTQHVNSPLHDKSPFYTKSPSLLLKPSNSSPILTPSGLLYPPVGPSMPFHSPSLSSTANRSTHSDPEGLRVPKPTAVPQSVSNFQIPTYIIETPGDIYDNVDEENRLLLQGVDKLTGQWKEMVGQLDQVWNLLDGDSDAKYHKLKIRITSMLLWDNINVSRSMLSPPLDTLRQMNEDHERRLLSLPQGTLFHNSSQAEITYGNARGVTTPRFQLPT